MSDEAKENVPTRATRAATHATPATVTRAKRGGGTTNVGSSLNDGANAVDASDDATEALAATRARGVLVDASNGGELGGDAPTEAIAPGHKMGANGAGGGERRRGDIERFEVDARALGCGEERKRENRRCRGSERGSGGERGAGSDECGADGERGGRRPG